MKHRASPHSSSQVWRLIAGLILSLFAFSLPAANPPSAPTGVSATDGTLYDRISVTWSNVADATGYLVLRNITNVFPTSTEHIVGLVATNRFATNHFDNTTALQPGVTFWYWVVATNSAGASPHGSPDSGYVGVLQVPTGLVAGDGTVSNQIVLHWNAVPGAAAYQIYRGPAWDPALAALLQDNVTQTDYVDTNLVSGVIYFYWVQAVNSLQTSGLSDPDAGWASGNAHLYVHPTGFLQDKETLVTVTATRGARFYAGPDLLLTNVQINITQSNQVIQTVSPVSIGPTNLTFWFPKSPAGYYGFGARVYLSGKGGGWVTVYHSSPNFFKVVASGEPEVFSFVDDQDPFFVANPAEYITLQDVVGTGSITNRVVFPAYVNDGDQVLSFSATYDFPYDDEDETGVKFNLDFILEGTNDVSFNLPFELTVPFPEFVYPGEKLKMEGRVSFPEPGTVRGVHQLAYSTQLYLWLNLPYDYSPPVLDATLTQTPQALELAGRLYDWEFPTVSYNDGGQIVYDSIIFRLGGNGEVDTTGALDKDPGSGLRQVWSEEALGTGFWYVGADLIELIANTPALDPVSEACGVLSDVGVGLDFGVDLGVKTSDLVHLFGAYDVEIQVPPLTQPSVPSYTNLTLDFSFKVDLMPFSQYTYNLGGKIDLDMPFIDAVNLATWTGFDIYSQRDFGPRNTLEVRGKMDVRTVVMPLSQFQARFVQDLPPGQSDLAGYLPQAANVTPEQEAAKTGGIKAQPLAAPPLPPSYPTLVTTNLAPMTNEVYPILRTVSPSRSGKILADPPGTKGRWAPGTVVTLTAQAAPGYQFLGWSGDATGSANPVKVTVPNDALNGVKQVTALFALDSASISATGLVRQIYTNITGSTIADLLASPKFPNAPDIVDSVPTLESQWLPNDAGDNYGQRLTGWLVPPVSGDYVFYLASDDAGQVFLSTDESAANMRLIVEETSWSPWRNWEGTAQNPQRASASISLVAGTKYYLEVLHKEGAVGDHVAVAWKSPGGTAPKNGDPPIGGQYLLYRADLAPGLSFTVDCGARPLGGGMVSLNPPLPANGHYTNGTVVTVTALPTSGYQFSGWGGALAGAASPVTLTLTSNLAANANFDTVLPLAPLVNPSFETDRFTVWAGGVEANGPITGWTNTPGWSIGINPVWPYVATNYPFADNGAIPDGSQVAFMQADGTLSQVVKGLVVGGTYRVDYCENGRLHGDAGNEVQLEVRMGGVVIVPAHGVPSVGGSNPYTAQHSQTFVATNAQMELAFVKAGPAGLDRTVLIDDVRVVYLLAPAAPTECTLVVRTTPGGCGTVAAEPGPAADGRYQSGTVVTLTANPGSGFHFDSWSGAATGTNAFVTLALESNAVLTAVFRADRSVTGQWDFDVGDLRATVGLPLDYFDPAAGNSQGVTEFGATTDFGLPPIGGEIAKVLRFGGATNNTIGYVCPHGAGANGGGTKVNQWTLLFDLLVPPNGGAPWLSFGQIDDLANVGDGDLFIHWTDGGAGLGEVGGIGIAGQYTAADGTNYLRRGQWYRVAFAMDCTTNNTSGQGVLRKFINGVRFGEQGLGAGALDGRFALNSGGLILLADNDGESQLAYFNSIQVRNYTMSDAEIAALGRPQAAGLSAPPAGYALEVWNNSPAWGAVTATPAPGPDGTYAAGTAVTLRAEPRNGYEFGGWGGDAAGAANPLAMAMSGNKSVTATFGVQGTLAPVYAPGLLRQIYTNITGSSIADLLASPKFPSTPDIVDSVPTLESQWLPNDAGDNYGQRLSGWLVPPLSGNYVFYLASDDAGQVFLSTDESAANKRLIVEETSWSPWRNWEGTAQNPQRASTNITLVAGQYYYLEVLHKEGNGGDHVAVAWKLPGSSAPLNGSDPIGGTNLVYRTDIPVPIFLALRNGNLTLSWDPGARGFKLETATNLHPPVQWTTVSTPTNNQVVLPIQGATRFYRLRK